MFLVCGDLPIYQLKKDGEEWSFEELNIKIPPFGELVDNTSSVQKYTAPGNYIFKATETGLHTVTVAGAGGGGSGVARKASDKQSSGGNGGRGGLHTFEIELTKDASYDVIVGAGGKGGAVHYGEGYGNAGGNGGSSSALATPLKVVEGQLQLIALTMVQGTARLVQAMAMVAKAVRKELLIQMQH